MMDLRFVNILDVDAPLQEKVRQWRNKDRVRQGMIQQDVISKEEHRKWLSRLVNNRKDQYWVVYDSGIPMGMIYLKNIDFKNKSSEWGFYIGEDAYAGKGYGKAVLRKFLTQFFDEMKFELLITKVLVSNTVARHLYEKFRFRPDSSRERDEVLTLRFNKVDWNQLKKESYACA